MSSIIKILFMKQIPRTGIRGILAIVLFSSIIMGMRETPLFMREGVWRGVFQVNGVAVPFNFELKGKDAEHAVFSLINGRRRDEFRIKRIGDDSLFIKIDTYDAALVARIESDGRITGEYRSPGPALTFSAEAGKSYRFVEPGKEVASRYNLSGKWELQVSGKDIRIGLLKQEGNKLTGVIMSVMGDSRELEGTVQGNDFELSGFTGPGPVYMKGKIGNDMSLTGEFRQGINNIIKFEGTRNEDAEFPDPYKMSYLKYETGYDISYGRIAGQKVVKALSRMKISTTI